MWPWADWLVELPSNRDSASSYCSINDSPYMFISLQMMQIFHNWAAGLLWLFNLEIWKDWTTGFLETIGLCLDSITGFWQQRQRHRHRPNKNPRLKRLNSSRSLPKMIQNLQISIINHCSIIKISSQMLLIKRVKIQTLIWMPKSLDRQSIVKLQNLTNFTISHHNCRFITSFLDMLSAISWI